MALTFVLLGRCQQRRAEFGPRFGKEIIGFGPTFDGSRLEATGTIGIHFEVAQRHAGRGVGQSAQGVREAEAFDRDALAVGGCVRDGADQVVNQGKRR
jgi:hypothetical protein